MTQFQASDGIRLAYDITDFTDPWIDPSTLILLHAAMGSSQRFYAMVPPLCRRYRVVRLDLRGHGQSDVPPPDPPLTMDRLVQDVRELMGGLGCSRVHLVGNSAGGYVAQNLAMQSPELVATRRPPGAARIPGRDDRRSLSDRPRSTAPRMVSRRGGKERRCLYRPVHWADDDARLDGGIGADHLPRTAGRARRRDGGRRRRV